MFITRRTRPRLRKGFSLLELVVAASAAIVLVLGVGIMLAHSQHGFNRMYKRVHSDVVEDAYRARRTFDRVVRKSTMKRCDLMGSLDLYVYYYSDPEDRTIPEPDRYARFNTSINSSELFVDYGNVPAGTLETLSPGSLSPSRRVLLARDVQVSESAFSVQGATVQMVLLLDNDSETMLVTSSAIRNNK